MAVYFGHPDRAMGISTFWTALLVVLAIFVFWYVYRSRKHGRHLNLEIAQICKRFNAPNTEFDLNSAISQVMMGTRQGLVDGQWWVATGIEQVEDHAYTRVLREFSVGSESDVEAAINEMFSVHEKQATERPNWDEGRYGGSLDGDHGGIVHAQVIGKWRPIGGWLVAVPPWLVNSNRRL